MDGTSFWTKEQLDLIGQLDCTVSQLERRVEELHNNNMVQAEKIRNFEEKVVSENWVPNQHTSRKEGKELLPDGVQAMYSCKICDDGVIRDRNRALEHRHIIQAYTSTPGEYIFHCITCPGWTFTRSHELVRHCFVVHSSKTYVCLICSERDCLAGILTHVKLHGKAGERYSCRTCCRTFVYECNRQKHMSKCPGIHVKTEPN